LKVIHQRLITEAQRNLIYTGKTAADIALSLGFSDPAYFNRFFKRMTGQTPKNFRTSMNSGLQG
jgi:AraC family transcriptional activator of pobA